MLNVSHVIQTNPQGRNSCVPASLSMVLAYQGVTLSEQELCDLLDTQLAGTEVWNVLLLEKHVANCHVELDGGSLYQFRIEIRHPRSGDFSRFKND